MYDILVKVIIQGQKSGKWLHWAVGRKKEPRTKEENFLEWWKYSILDSMVVTQPDMPVWTHWTVYLKRMSSTIYKLYLNKPNFKKRILLWGKFYLTLNLSEFSLNFYTFMSLLLEYLIYAWFHSISMPQWSDIISSINFSFMVVPWTIFWNFFPWVNLGIYIFTSLQSSKYRVYRESVFSVCICALNSMVELLKLPNSHTSWSFTAELHSLTMPPDNKVLLALQLLKYVVWRGFKTYFADT